MNYCEYCNRRKNKSFCSVCRRNPNYDDCFVIDSSISELIKATEGTEKPIADLIKEVLTDVDIQATETAGP